MKKYPALLLAFVFYSGFSQCEDAEKLDFGGTYMSRTKNYIRFEEKFKDSIYLENISYPEDIKKIEKYSDFILLEAEKYILERGGNDFRKKIKIQGFEVNYKDSTKINYENPDIYNLSNYDVSYWIIYTYKNKNIEYGFGLEFDKSGEMISENKFPKYSDNSTFENFSDYCKALDLVKNEKQFKNKKVEYIELAYMDEINSFCWLIEEKSEPNTELGRWQERSTNQYFINANTIKLETIKKNRTMSISCGAKLILIKKSKKQLRKEKREKRLLLKTQLSSGS